MQQFLTCVNLNVKLQFIHQLMVYGNVDLMSRVCKKATLMTGKMPALWVQEGTICI
jgi:hypothetical protein